MASNAATLQGYEASCFVSSSCKHLQDLHGAIFRGLTSATAEMFQWPEGQHWVAEVARAWRTSSLQRGRKLLERREPGRPWAGGKIPTIGLQTWALKAQSLIWAYSITLMGPSSAILLEKSYQLLSLATWFDCFHVRVYHTIWQWSQGSLSFVVVLFPCTFCDPSHPHSARPWPPSLRWTSSIPGEHPCQFCG